MPSTVTLLYPAVAFDMDYYLTKHMPLVQKIWGSSGLTSWSVTKCDPSSGHATICSMVWESGDAFLKAAQASSAGEIMGDIKNYTEGKPTTLVGEVVGSS